MVKITDEHELSETEQVTRFGLGAIVGFIFGLILYVVSTPASVLSIALLFIFCAFGTGVLALFQGDRFWYRLSRLLSLL